MKTIKSILVPIDFSANSRAALDFAFGLAEANQASVKIIHIYSPYAVASPLADSLIIPQAETVEDYEKVLEQFVEAEKGTVDGVWLKDHVEYEAVPGDPGETIVDMSKSSSYDLLIMGVTTKKNFGEIMFGSTATKVSQKADCPVLFVPSNSNYTNIQNIVYACDFDHTADKHVGLVAEAAMIFKSNLHLLFVKTEDSYEDDYSNAMSNMERLFASKAPNVVLTMRVLEADSVVEGINDYSKEIKADLVTVVTKHRGFLSRMLHSSMTKEIVMYAEEPILVIHAD